MKIKKGDTVLVITGKDKGKTGEVIAAFPKENRVVVRGVNIQTKHEKAKMDQPAQIIKVEGPIDASNVMFYDKATKAPTRLGYTGQGKDKKRVSKKTGAVVD